MARIQCKTAEAGASNTVNKPKRLSVAGEWLRKHPKGLGGRILDMRAVMR